MFQDRIDFRYNGGWSGSLCILYDNKVLANFSSNYWGLPMKNRYTPVMEDEFGEALDIMNNIIGDDEKPKLVSPREVESMITNVFNDLSIKEALNNEKVIIRAIALLDKRCGKRTFVRLDYSHEEDFLLRNIYNLRKKLEGK